MLGRHGHHLLQRSVGGAGQQERHVGLARSRGQHAVGIGPEEPRQARGRDPDGAAPAPPEQRQGLVAAADVAQVARHQAVRIEGRAVAGQALLVVGAAFDEVEGDARQLAPRQALQIVEIDDGLQVHRIAVMPWDRAAGVGMPAPRFRRASN